MNELALLLVVFVCSVSGLPTLNERVTGGGVAAAAQFPYVVSITENDRHFCAGFIYNSRWVVTTASCVVGKTASKLKVVAGQLSLVNADAEQTITVFSIVPFTQYNSTLKLNDIALVKLTADIVFNATTPSVVDFIEYNEVDDTLTGEIMGWGASYDGGLESINLRYGAVDIQKVTSTAPCDGYVTGTDFNVATMACVIASATATSPGVPCQFDEGGPLVQAIPNPSDPTIIVKSVVGIMSKNKSCDLAVPSVFTRVSVFYAWLSSTAGAQPTRP